MSSGGALPKALLEKPVLRVHLAETWRAFFDLGTTRALGFGTIGPIPWTAIDAYAGRFGIEGGAFERLARFIGAMDGVYLEHVGKKRS